MSLLPPSISAAILRFADAAEAKALSLAGPDRIAATHQMQQAREALERAIERMIDR